MASLVRRFGVPFIVWTDHKNLEYIKSAKRLYSRQARWALFSSHFNFSISYQPGSKNIKPNVLSLIFDHSERLSFSEPIVPQKCFVSAVTWKIELKVHTASQGVTLPPGCSPGPLFVSEIWHYSWPSDQCWGMLLLKVMHYNIALFLKK